MKCKQKLRNGKLCKFEADSDSQFCYVHNPKLLPVFFLGNVDGFERNDFETTMPIEKAQSYIDDGYALKIDYAFRVKMEKTVLRLITKLTKDRLKDVKHYIKTNDKTSLMDFFKDSPKNNPEKVLKFVNEKDFSEKEKTFLRNFIAANY